MKRRTYPVIGTAIAALALAGCGANGDTEAAEEDTAEQTSAQTEETFELRVGATTTSQAATVYIAESEGFFEDAGLDVEISVIQAAASAIPSLLNQELHFTLLTTV